MIFQPGKEFEKTVENRSNVALVTGAASGIGAAISVRLAEQGWLVAGVDLKGSQTDLSLIVDVTDIGAIYEATSRAESELGPISLLVTVAGHYEIIPVSDIDLEQWHYILKVHLGGTRNVCSAVLPSMLEKGGGHIVTIGSELALGGGDGEAHYAAAKGAIIGFTKSLAAEVASSGVQVNCVAPGPTDTPLLEADSLWRADDFLRTLPLRRLVQPEEVAETVLLLAEEGGYYCGQVLSPNAGAVI